MNYSYETVFCCWAESLLLAQISMMYYESALKIMFCSENLGFIGQSDAFFVVNLADLIFDFKFC